MLDHRCQRYKLNGVVIFNVSVFKICCLLSRFSFLGKNCSCRSKGSFTFRCCWLAHCFNAKSIFNTEVWIEHKSHLIAKFEIKFPCCQTFCERNYVDAINNLTCRLHHSWIMMAYASILLWQEALRATRRYHVPRRCAKRTNNDKLWSHN